MSIASTLGGVSDEKKLAGRPFVKGQSGNPGGRAKGYERRLREVVDSMTADDPVIDPELAYDEATKKLRRIPAFDAIVKRAVLDAVAGDRYAREFVADRIMGKPKQHVDIKPVGTRAKADLSGLSIDQKRELLEGYEKMRSLAVEEQPAEEDGDATPTEH